MRRRWWLIERQLSRYELARAVYPGRPIAWTDLTPRALVRKGELVDVVVREGALSISMKAWPSAPVHSVTSWRCAICNPNVNFPRK